MSLDACLIRRTVLLASAGLDAAYRSRAAAGLDLGLRLLRGGAIVEHWPELAPEETSTGPGAMRPCALPRDDLYTFVVRHLGPGWARYLAARRALGGRGAVREWRSLGRARAACMDIAPPRVRQLPQRDAPALRGTPRISVVVPTLDRYAYLPGALESLRRQTIRPYEVIVVDQNSPAAREPRVYDGYEDLRLRVIWQEERGQSLARNTGLQAAAGEYVLFFDDDSVAAADLIERHLHALADGRFHVSTGVALPPGPVVDERSLGCPYPRLAQTLDTGNCLVSRTLARAMGGLDRNYDFGPGADGDFGTRIYLAGYRILHNPAARRVHFKAAAGGLRLHGAHKYNTDAGLLAPFPPVTQSYYALRYLTPRQRRERSILAFAASKLPARMRVAKAPRMAIGRACIALVGTSVLLPIKRWRSLRAARAMLARGVRTARFGPGAEGEA